MNLSMSTHLRKKHIMSLDTEKLDAKNASYIKGKNKEQKGAYLTL